MDRETFKIITASVDFCIQLIAEAPQRVQELQNYVADPEKFAKHYKGSALTTLDETALWLKLCGEENVYLALSEVLSQKARHDARKAIRAAQKAEVASEVKRRITINVLDEMVRARKAIIEAQKGEDASEVDQRVQQNWKFTRFKDFLLPCVD